MQNETEPAPAGVNPNNSPGGTITGGVARGNPNSRDNLIPMGDHSHFNFALVLAWLVALLAILAMLYFWWLSRNIVDVVAEKQSKLDSINQQIEAPAMVKVAKDSNDFKTSVGILSQAKKDRFSIATFLPTLYTKVTNDVKINSLALTTEGKLSIAGTTKNYRTTADLVMALKSWGSLSNVDLMSVAMMADDAGKIEANFSISADVVKAPAVVASSTNSTTQSISQPGTGGVQ